MESMINYDIGYVYDKRTEIIKVCNICCIKLNRYGS